jgi:predicted DNA-binding transcriptional regulator YafY
MDRRIVEFFTSHKYELSEKNMSFEEKCKILRKAMKEKEFLEITYLKTDDTKSVRKIRPEFIGDMEYSGKTFFGMEAFCATRKDTRCFRIDRILKIS